MASNPGATQGNLVQTGIVVQGSAAEEALKGVGWKFTLGDGWRFTLGDVQDHKQDVLEVLAPFAPQHLRGATDGHGLVYLAWDAHADQLSKLESDVESGFLKGALQNIFFDFVIQRVTLATAEGLHGIEESSWRQLDTPIKAETVVEKAELHLKKLRQAIVTPTPDEEQTLDDLAREVLMVDEHNNSLIPGFIDILRNGITPLPDHIVKRDVLIVGAGIAGLVAGKILKRAGYNVTILESHNTRVGGRIKTFINTETHSAPFSDPRQYAEAGAMRIPSVHPLVNEVIELEGLSDKKRLFYNADVDPKNVATVVNRTRIALNGQNVLRSDYLTGSLDDPSLGFGSGIRDTANELLDEALEEPNSLVNPARRNIEEQVEGWKKIIAEYDNDSMREYLLKYFTTRLHQDGNIHVHKDANTLTATQIETLIQYIGTLQNLTSRLFLSFFHAFIDTILIRPGNVYYELAGGNWQLPYAIARHLKEEIVMNARVVNLHFDGHGQAIHKGRSGVYVKTHSDFGHAPLTREYTADYALVTIPFSALRVVSTKPLFSLQKRRAIIELHYDSATKILLEFNQRWWEFSKEEWERKLPDPYVGHKSLGGYSITDSPNRFIYFPSHKVPGSPGGIVLASYVWSDEANRWDSMLHEHRYQVALDGLAEIYGQGIKRFYTGHGQTESWMQDPYVMGEAAVFSPGQAQATHPYIKVPEKNVFFAGEHASLKHAWIEGAIETAIFAVLQIHCATLGVSTEHPGRKQGPRKKAVREHIHHFSPVSQRSTSEPALQRQISSSTSTSTLPQTAAPAKGSVTIATYLQTRLEQLGLGHLFAIAGNYTAPFLNTLITSKSSIKIEGVPNELIAGYAADAYARFEGIAAVAVTYGTGALSILNAIAGSQVEQVPVILINGAPTNKERLNSKYAGIIYSHTSSANPESNLDAFRPVTCAAEVIVNGASAPFQIDAALTAAVTQLAPAYLEIGEDVWRSTCDGAALGTPLPRSPSAVVSAPSSVDDAVKATIELLKRYTTPTELPRPVFWVGHEIHRQKLQSDVLDLLEKSGIKYTTTILGKSVLSEDHPSFLGVHVPGSDAPGMLQLLRKTIIIGLGAWTTSKDAGNKGVQGDNVILAANGGVIVGSKFYPSVGLKEYINKLGTELAGFNCNRALVKPNFFSLTGINDESYRFSNALISFETFFDGIKDWVNNPGIPTTVVSDAGFSLIAAQNLHISRQNGFVSQATWLSIGYSAGAAVGISYATNNRTVAIIGDGAMQETAQAVAAVANRDVVIFVLDNGIYGIEQQLVNPNPLRTIPTNYRPPNEILNSIYAYNKLPHWEYSKLVDVFGGIGAVVTTDEELTQVLTKIDANRGKLFVVHVKLPTNSAPYAIQARIAEHAGEDETAHAGWPPADVF